MCVWGGGVGIRVRLLQKEVLRGEAKELGWEGEKIDRYWTFYAQSIAKGHIRAKQDVIPTTSKTF